MARRRAQRPLPSGLELGTLAAAGLGGALGLLPGAHGAADPIGLLAWLALWSLPAGFLVGASGLPLLPVGLAAPGLWSFFVVQADFASSRDLAEPLWALLAVTGLYGIGLGLGRRLAAGPGPGVLACGLRGAGVLLLSLLLLSGLCVQGGLTRGGASWGASHPRLARTLLNVSPVVLVLDCAGQDWTHSQPMVYRLSGVEWFHRRPWPGTMTGSLLLVVGCLSASLVRSGSEPAPAAS